MTLAFSNFFLSSPSKNILVAVPRSLLLNFEVLTLVISEPSPAFSILIVSFIFATKDPFAMDHVFSAKDISSSDPLSSRSGVVIVIWPFA